MLRPARALSALVCVLPLISCAGSSPPVLLTKIQVEQPQVPPALLSCKADPAVPDGSADDEAAADYVLDVWRAGKDCRDKLAAVKGLVGSK